MSASDIAEQMTLIQFEIFASIQPNELLNGAWTKPKYQHMTQNVLKFITSFNNLANWISLQIVSPESLKIRRKNYSKAIDIAREFFRLQNLNGVMAINAAMNSTAVYRLKFTTQNLSKNNEEFLSHLSELLDPQGNYLAYREYLKNLVPPLIPFIGLFLTDLIFIDEGNQAEVDGLINFFKHNLVYKVISSLRDWQLTRYTNLEINQKIRPSLDRLNSISNEELLYKLSIIREPRGCTQDQISP